MGLESGPVSVDAAGNVGGGAVRLASSLDLRDTARDYISSFDRLEGPTAPPTTGYQRALVA